MPSCTSFCSLCKILSAFPAGILSPLLFSPLLTPHLAKLGCSSEVRSITSAGRELTALACMATAGMATINPSAAAVPKLSPVLAVFCHPSAAAFRAAACPCCWQGWVGRKDRSAITAPPARPAGPPQHRPAGSRGQVVMLQGRQCKKPRSESSGQPALQEKPSRPCCQAGAPPTLGQRGHRARFAIGSPASPSLQDVPC